MKKTIIYLIGCLVVFMCACSVLFDFNGKDKALKKIKVAEVAHTIFYAPQYVAIEKGFFEEEGLDIELILSNGVNKTMYSNQN